MKKGFFTSNIFRFFIAFSITLGVFLVPISILRERTPTGGVSYIHIQKASADAVNTKRGWWNKDKCYSTQTDEQVDCESGNVIKGGGFFSGLLEIILSAIAYIFLATRALAALLLTISAWVLDQSLKATISFDYGQIGGVSDVWRIVRDSFNVLFVFILLWAGITQIIGIAKTNTKQIIIGVVIAGLLINFSMFFARVLIDASNITSTALYNQIVNTSGSATNNFSLSSGLTQGLGVAAITITNSNAFTADWEKGSSEIGKASGVLSTFQIILLFVMQIAVYLIAAFAFISVCILFIGRIVMLTLLLALSPIGFLGTSAIGGVLSKVRDASKWWWDEFSAQLFVTPIFLLLIFITIKVATGVGSTEMNSILETMKGGSVKSVDFTMFLKFGIVIFLILKTVEITKKSSGSVGQSINSFGSKAVGFGLGVATGGAALALRSSVGRLAASAANSDKLKGAAAQGGIKGLGARMALRASSATSKASFDARNTESGKFLAKKSGIDANANIPGFTKAKTGGFMQAQKAYTQGKVENAKLMNRDDLKESDALQEHENIKAEHRSKVADLRNQVRELDAIAFDNTKSRQEKEIAQRQAEGVTATLEKEQEKLKAREAMEGKGRDAQGKLVKEAIDAITKERKSAYQATYATSVENSPIAYIRGHNKIAADKIRRDVVKGKSTKEKLAEAYAAAQKEEEAQKAEGTKASGTPSSDNSSKPVPPSTPPSGGGSSGSSVKK
jgi:hypothetical protein